MSCAAGHQGTGGASPPHGADHPGEAGGAEVGGGLGRLRLHAVQRPGPGPEPQPPGAKGHYPHHPFNIITVTSFPLPNDSLPCLIVIVIMVSLGDVLVIMIVILIMIRMSIGDGCSDNDSDNDSDNGVFSRWLL